MTQLLAALPEQTLALRCAPRIFALNVPFHPVCCRLSPPCPCAVRPPRSVSFGPVVLDSVLLAAIVENSFQLLYALSGDFCFLDVKLLQFAQILEMGQPLI